MRPSVSLLVHRLPSGGLGWIATLPSPYALARVLEYRGVCLCLVSTYLYVDDIYICMSVCLSAPVSSSFVLSRLSLVPPPIPPPNLDPSSSQQATAQYRRPHPLPETPDPRDAGCLPTNTLRPGSQPLIIQLAALNLIYVATPLLLSVAEIVMR